MNQELTYLINSIIDIACCVILFIIMCLSRIKIKKTNSNRQFFLLSLSVFLFNLGDLANWTCEGLSHGWNVPALHIMTFVYYLSQPILFIFFLGFLRERYYDKSFRLKLYRICIGMCSLAIILAFISAYPGLLYSFSSDNIYSRTKYNIINIILLLICYCLCILYIFCLKEQISKKEFLSSLTFPILPLLFNIPQFFLYGIATVNIGIVISMIFLYLNIYRKSKAKEQEDKEFTSELFANKNSVSFLEKVKRFFLYYRYSKEAITSIRDELNESVLNTHGIIFLASSIISLISFGFSFVIQKQVELRTMYILLFAVCTCTYIISKLLKPNSRFIYTLCILTIFMVVGLVMYQECYVTPNEKSVLLVCILFGIPVLYCYKPCVVWIILASIYVVYNDLAHIYKPADIAATDSVYLFIMTVLGMIVGYQVGRFKIKSAYLGKNLDNEITAKTEQINGISHEIVRTLTSLIESKDDYTNGHSERVANYSVMIAEKLGWSDEKCNELWMEAILHDVGKIGIPDSILKKTDKLTDEEFAVIKTHTLQGEKILQNLKSFPNAKDAAKHNHEKYNGRGYPSNLKEENIPVNARIVAIADAFDAMTSSRCYRPALQAEVVIAELEKGRGTQFDPEFIDIFLEILKENKDTLLKPKEA